MPFPGYWQTVNQGVEDLNLGVPHPMLDTTTDTPLPELTPIQRLIQSFSGTQEDPTFAHPRGFIEGLVSGGAQGLGSAGSRDIASRAKLQAILDERAKMRNEMNAKATLDYQQERGRAAAAARAYKLKTPTTKMVDQPLIDRQPGMKSMLGQPIDRNEYTRLMAQPTGREKITQQGAEEAARVGARTQAEEPTIKELADQVEQGLGPPDMQRLYRYAAPVRAELQRRHYDLSAATMDWIATQTSIKSLNGTQQTRLRQAVETAYHSLDVIDNLSDRLQKLAPQFRTSVPVINHASLEILKNLPGEAGIIARELDAQIKDVVSELGNAYMGGNSPTDHALQLAASNLNSNWNNPTLKSLTLLARKNLQIRRNSIYQSRAVNPNNPTPQMAPQPGGFFDRLINDTPATGEAP